MQFNAAAPKPLREKINNGDEIEEGRLAMSVSCGRLGFFFPVCAVSLMK